MIHDGGGDNDEEKEEEVKEKEWGMMKLEMTRKAQGH